MHRFTIFFFLGSILFLGALGAYSFWELNRHEGLVREYYGDGSLRSEVVFKNGLPDDTAKTFYKNGQLRRIAYFKNGRQLGQTLSYYENGKLKAEEFYHDSMLSGHCKFYDENGALQWEADFQNGVIVAGTRKDYLPK
jgi:antitoxin component YwqK of YwqJK toxin-antitoxin module